MQSPRSDSIVANGRSVRRVRVVVADPFPVVLLGVRKMLEDHPHLQMVGELATMPSLLKKVITETPDIAIVDWALALQDLKTTAVLIRSALHKTSLVFLTSSDNPQDRRTMVRLGVGDLVSKRASQGEMQRVVWNAWNRNSSVLASASDSLLCASTPVHARADSERRIRQLTPRQRELIPLVCGGMRNKAIAQYLGIAESTVWHHLTAIFTKLQVEDRMGLAAFAYRQGLIVPRAQAIAGDSPQAC